MFLLIDSFQMKLLFLEQIRFQNEEKINKKTRAKIWRRKSCDTRIAGDNYLNEHIRHKSLTDNTNSNDNNNDNDNNNKNDNADNKNSGNIHFCNG